MCGILAIFGSQEAPQDIRKRALELSGRLRHRGPDWNGVFQFGNNLLAHERLAIVDVDGGAQPLLNETGKIALTVNGEIYNHLALRANLTNHTFKTNSDCEPILYLYEDHGDDFVHLLRGDFAFVVYDTTTGHYLAARDPIGVGMYKEGRLVQGRGQDAPQNASWSDSFLIPLIVPLYMGRGKDGSIWFASECKALKDDTEFEAFPPGHFYSSKTGKTERYFKPSWWDEVPPQGPSPITPDELAKLRKSLEDSVVRRMMCDVPFGVLLSGGLDSSLVASIVSRHTEAKSREWWPRLHSFCVGIKGAPDLIAAKQVADFLGTVHHEFHFTVQEGIDALRDVIFHLETYDVTTVS